MLDPLSAASLAGNIVQFIELSWNVAAGTHEIYMSGEGSLAEEQHLKDITASLAKLSKELQDGYSSMATAAADASTEVTDQEREIALIAQRCQKDSELLISELREVQMD